MDKEKAEGLVKSLVDAASNVACVSVIAQVNSP